MGTTFIGSSEHNLDEKNRLAIAAKFRNQINPEADGGRLVIVPMPEETQGFALWVFTERQFDRLSGRQDSSLMPEDDVHRYQRIIYGLSERVELDSQGRIVIPEKLLSLAELGREVVVVGVVDHLEIRRKADHEKSIQDELRQLKDLQRRAREAAQRQVRQSGDAAGLS